MILNPVKQLKKILIGLKEDGTRREAREVERPMSLRRFTYLGGKVIYLGFKVFYLGFNIPGLKSHLMISSTFYQNGVYSHYHYSTPLIIISITRISIIVFIILIFIIIIVDVTFWRRSPWHQHKLYSSTKPYSCLDGATWSSVLFLR